MGDKSSRILLCYGSGTLVEHFRLPKHCKRGGPLNTQVTDPTPTSCSARRVVLLYVFVPTPQRKLLDALPCIGNCIPAVACPRNFELPSAPINARAPETHAARGNPATLDKNASRLLGRAVSWPWHKVGMRTCTIRGRRLSRGALGE